MKALLTLALALILATGPNVFGAERVHTGGPQYSRGLKIFYFPPLSDCDSTGLITSRTTRVDTAHWFIESLDTLEADTCKECPDGYEPIEGCSKPCVRKPKPIDPCKQYGAIPLIYYEPCADYLLKITPTKIDTVWRRIPDGFEKAEWMKLWNIMHPPPIRFDTRNATLRHIEDSVTWRTLEDVTAN